MHAVVRVGVVHLGIRWRIVKPAVSFFEGLGCNDRFGPVALTRVSYAGPVYASRWQLQLRLRSLDRDLSRGLLRSYLSRRSGLVPEGLHPGQPDPTDGFMTSFYWIDHQSTARVAHE